MGTAQLIAQQRPAQCRAQRTESGGNPFVFGILVGFCARLYCYRSFEDELSCPRPDRSPEAVAKRKKATDQARAANMRRSYVHDPLLEAATAAYVAGDITRDEYKERVVRKPQ